MLITGICKIVRSNASYRSCYALFKPSSCSISTTEGAKEEEPVKLIRLEGESNGIAVIALNRPQAKNAISVRFLQLFTEALDSLKHDKGVRSVIVRSLAPGIFCAGADLKERAKMVQQFIKLLKKH